jgi:hypothetical protein
MKETCDNNMRRNPGWLLLIKLCQKFKRIVFLMDSYEFENLGVHIRAALVMEAASISETLVNFYRTTQCSIP